MGDIQKYNEKVFESIKNIDENGKEFWYARDLQYVLEYSEWRNFKGVIDKAKESCENSDNTVVEHFVDVNKMIDLAKTAQREISDIKLSRYASYLIVQNADSSKEVVALGQTYFAVQTRKQELNEQFSLLDEDERRLAIRNELKEHNKIRREI